MRFGAYLAGMKGIERPGKESLPRQLPELFTLGEMADTPAAPPLPRDVWLPETQVMVARAQGGSTAGLYLAAKGGHNAESHNHNDVGHFIVYADGRPVLIDIGGRDVLAQNLQRRPLRYLDHAVTIPQPAHRERCHAASRPRFRRP